MVLLPDTGFRYLSKTYNDTWMRSHGFLDEGELHAADIVSTDDERLISVTPRDTLGTAIDRMVEHSISQLPVIDGEKVVGSLTESVVLNRLIEEPGAKEHAVEDNMGAPLLVVDAHIPLSSLSNHLKEAPGAVLVRGDDNQYHIITKSDLIEALSSQNA